MRLFSPSALILLAISGCSVTPDSDQVSKPDVSSSSPLGDAPLRAMLDQAGYAEAILVLDDRIVDEEIAADSRLSQLSGDDPTILDYRARRQTEIWDDLVAVVGPQDFTVVRFWPHLGAAHIELSSIDALNRVVAEPVVVGLHPDQEFKTTAFDAESPALIDATTSKARGIQGSGVTVAVLDTGLNYKHADFGSCSAPGGTCIVAKTVETAANDNKLDDNGHGTNVSAIVRSIVPKAKLIGLDVFGVGGGASGTDILEGVEWIIANRATYNIRVANFSLGSSKYTWTGSAWVLADADGDGEYGWDAPCDADSFTAGWVDMIGDLYAAGVVSAIASGNDGWSSEVSAPACVSSAVTVGAVYDSNIGSISWSNCRDTSTAADQVTCFSNSNDIIDVLAPGALITGGGYSMGGTSQATPHIAGSLAAVAAAYPSHAIDKWIGAIVSHGPEITDSRNNLTFHRVKVTEAVGIDQADSHAPMVGTVSINSGASHTKATALTLTVGASPGDLDVTNICFSESSTCSAWKSLTSSANYAYTLAGSTNGTKTINTWWKDINGNVSASVTDTVVFDNKAPVVTSLSIAATDSLEGTISWIATDNTGTDGLRYVLKGVVGATAPANCNAGTTLYDGDEDSYIHNASSALAMANGTTFSYRLCVFDQATNNTTGKTASFKGRTDYQAPTGTIFIAGGAAATKVASAPYTLAASDDVTVSRYCLMGLGTTCTWMTWTGNVNTTINLGTTNGVKTVKARVQDAAGNQTEISDTIIFDKTAPTGGTVSITPNNLTAEIVWTSFTDAGGSGLSGYMITGPAATSGGVPVRCTGTAATTTDPFYDGTVSGTGTWYFRVCAVDGAGNVSEGKVASVTATSTGM